MNKIETNRQKIAPFLWFNDNAEEAANFYVSVFKNSRIKTIMPGPDGKAMGVNFELEGQEFMALNGGPQYQFTPAISFYVHCTTQAEVDELWEKLTAGGKEVQCGWLQDRFGLSWQVVPDILGELLQDKDRVKASRVMQAMMQMVKIDIEGLKQAAEDRVPSHTSSR